MKLKIIWAAGEYYGLKIETLRDRKRGVENTEGDKADFGVSDRGCTSRELGLNYLT